MFTHGLPYLFIVSNALAVRDVSVAWHKILQKVWNVPPRTNNRTIAFLSDSVLLDSNLKSHFCKLAKKILHSTDNVFIMKIAVSNRWSAVERNYRNLSGNENIRDGHQVVSPKVKMMLT